jgi:hypothetical protein
MYPNSREQDIQRQGKSTHDIRYLTKGLMLQELSRFVFALLKVNVDEFEWNLFLIQYDSDAVGTRGDLVSDEFKDHVVEDE